MTRKRLSQITKRVASIYAAAIVLAVLLRLTFPETDNVVYQTYRDIIPLIIALPAAFLAQAFQRRSSYLVGLRALWADIVDAIAATLTYTELPSSTVEQHADVLRRLSASLEGVRGFYANIPSSDLSRGRYPFEPLKQIYDLVRELGSGTAGLERREEAHDEIYQLWRTVREPLVAELDTEIPTHHHAAYDRTVRP